MFKRLSRRTLIISALAVFLIGGVAFAVVKNGQDQSKSGDVAANPDNGIDYGPPTEQEKNDTEQFKKDQVNNATQQNSPDNSTSVAITYAAQQGQQVSIQSYVNSVLEEGGTCTAELTRGTYKVVKTTPAFANVSTTSCQPFLINRSEFASAGEWQLKVSYKSQKFSAVSSTNKVVVQ